MMWFCRLITTVRDRWIRLLRLVFTNNPPVVSSAAVHPLGGLVPSIRGVVERILPPFLLNRWLAKATPSAPGAKVVRNIIAQLKRLEGVLREAGSAV
ncbi:hypothetical protein TcBrA4_0036640 [Trypanosoma cruzi]|nr:hypothetical protein TcBrA4_0036640 [Trypanosoma cruzi]